MPVELIALGLVGVILLLVLGTLLRFSVLSPRRTQGARTRLRHVERDVVLKLCGVNPSADLIQMYRADPVVEMSEFYLIDSSAEPSRRWFIGGFIPLASQDISETLKVTNLRDGIPIADDLSAGVYFVDRIGRVMLRSPENDADLQVATDVAAFRSFKIEASVDD